MQPDLPFDIDQLGLYASKNLLVILKLKIYSSVVWIPNKFSSFLRNSEYLLLISNSVRDLVCQQLQHLWNSIEIRIVEISLLHSRWKIRKTFTFKLYVLGKKKSSEFEALRIYWYSWLTSLICLGSKLVLESNNILALLMVRRNLLGKCSLSSLHINLAYQSHITNQIY